MKNITNDLWNMKNCNYAANYQNGANIYKLRLREPLKTLIYYLKLLKTFLIISEH